MSKLVVGDGLLASEIVQQTNWDYVSRKKNNKDCWELLPIILADSSDTIINCIANTDTYSDDKDSMLDVNFKFVVELVNELNLECKKIIHISTDYLYTYSKEDVTENDVPVHCNNWYGYTKLLADGYVQNFSDNYLICRMTHKPYPFPYNEAWTNQVGNFDYVNRQVERIVKLIDKNVTGVVNVGGEKNTMFELAKKTNKNVKPIQSTESVPQNVTMNVNKMKELLK